MATWPTDSVRTKNWGTEILTDSDLEAQYDLLHTWVNDAMDGSTGHDHSGGTNEGPQISLTAGVTGTLPVANGGTGLTTLAGVSAAIGNLLFPIGAIYTTITSTNPGTALGFGTWTAFGSGRCLVGLDSGQTEFDTVEETGGAKTHTLQVSEIPAHTHTLPSTGAAGSGSSGGDSGSGLTSGSTGGGGAHNNLQPYIVVYFFKRTA